MSLDSKLLGALGEIGKGADNAADALSTAGKAVKASRKGAADFVRMFGCFDAETLCLVRDDHTQPVATHTLKSQVGGAVVVETSRGSETLLKIKDVPLGRRVHARNPLENETEYDPANDGFTGWKHISLEIRHANGSVVDAEILRSAQWIQRNAITVGEEISFALTEIEVEGSGIIRSIVDAPVVQPGAGSVVIGRFVTREAANRVCVRLTDNTEIVGTANHPVWCCEDQDWVGLGALEPGKHVSSRSGTIAVESVESLPQLAPVYNIEVAGEHVYEITALGVLVHNTNWDCEKFLELRRKVVNGDTLNKADQELYDDLLEQVKKNYTQKLTKTDIDALKNAAPDDLVKGHLHHILAKLGAEKFHARIVALQEKLWKEHGIDPFMGLEIYTYAPMSGVHSDEAYEYVISSLEMFFERPRSTEDVIAFLRQLGEEAQEGFQ